MGDDLPSYKDGYDWTGVIVDPQGLEIDLDNFTGLYDIEDDAAPLLGAQPMEAELVAMDTSQAAQDIGYNFTGSSRSSDADTIVATPSSDFRPRTDCMQ